MAKQKKNSRSTIDRQTKKRTIGVMAQAILNRLAQLKRTRHWLAQQTGMRTATLYDYLGGKRYMRSDKVEELLAVLGLEVRAKR